LSRLLFAIVFCFAGVGCSNLNLEKPTAAVTGMAVKGVDANGFTMNFAVDVSNPNTVALPLGAADYKLSLAGTNVLQGKAKPGGSIPAGGRTTVALPVTMTYEKLLAAEQGIVKSSGNVPYAFNGGLSLNSGSPLAGDLRVPLQYNGMLPLKQILSDPQVLLQNPAAQKLAKDTLGGIFGR
jgi:LEA14-like dessication related protein